MVRTLAAATNNAEGGTNTTGVTVANSNGTSGRAFDQTSGMTFSSTHVLGTMAYECGSSVSPHSGGWDMRLAQGTPPFGTGGASFYVPTGFTFGCYLASAVATDTVGAVAGHEFRIKLTVSAGVLGFVLTDLTASTDTTFTSAPPLDTWFRFEWDFYVGSPTASSGRVVVRYFAAAANTTPTETVDITATVGNFHDSGVGTATLLYGKLTLGSQTTTSVWADNFLWSVGDFSDVVPPVGGSAGAKQGERKRRNRPDYVGWTIDGRSVDIAWDSATMSAPGGFERMDASVLTARLPASMDQGSLIQALRNDNSILYEAKIAAPAKVRTSTNVDENRTYFYTTGAVDELRRRSRRLPYQLYGGTVWSDQQQPPYTYASTEKTDLFSKDNFIGWTVNNVAYVTGNKAGYALLVKGWDLPRIAFTIKKTADLANFDLKLYTANSVGTLVLEHSWALGAANPDGTAIDYAISSAGVGDTLSLQVEATSNHTPAKTKVWLNDLRVNGFTTSDSLKTSGVMEDLGNRCGFNVDAVQPSDIYALPLDWTDTWAALADFLAGVDDFYWLVDVDSKQQAFGALAYGPWGGEDQERIWHGELASGVEENLTLLPLYNRVEVTYERPAGVPQVFTATAGGTTGITDPYPSDVFPYPEILRLDVAQADQTMAQTLAENALGRFTRLRAQGTCTVSAIKNGSPLDIRPGDVFKIDDFEPALPAQRITQVSYKSDGTTDVTLERTFDLGQMLARLSARVRHAKGLSVSMGVV